MGTPGSSEDALQVELKTLKSKEKYFGFEIKSHLTNHFAV